MKRYETFKKFLLVNYMGRLSTTDYEKKLMAIHTALLRGFKDGEIMTAEKISRTTLFRYKRTIRRRGLKLYPQLAQESKFYFVTQLNRWEDVIRQANRSIMDGTGKIAPLLRVINNATKNILEYMFRVGMIPEVPKEIRLKGDVDANLMNEAMRFLGKYLSGIDDELAARVIEVIKLAEAAGT